MAQVLAVADFEVEFVDYTRGTVIDFADAGVINYLRMRRVISTSAADVAAAIAGGATQRTHTAGSPPGSGTVPGGSGSVAVQSLSADRALTAADNGANLVLTANRAVTAGPGFNQGVQFTNNSSSASTITVTPTGGATVNGGTTAVTRTIPPWQTTALSAVNADGTAYALHGA